MSEFPATLDLSSLDGSTGFRLTGAAQANYAGYSVDGAGDFNGDGYGDLVVGAYGADPASRGQAGATYVVFGAGGGTVASLDLSQLNGSNGFQLIGAEGSDQSGYSVASAGDVNGDGLGDIIIGAPTAGGDDAGASYLVFGRSGGFSALLDLGALSGSDGVRFSGANAGDNSGQSVSSIGDINGDGLDDLMIGAHLADPNGSSSGAAYVVLGQRAGWAPDFGLDSLTGSNGFRLEGVAASDQTGWSVSGAGDLNGDGYDDMLVGAWAADPGGNLESGATYVIFGGSGGFATSTNLSTLDGNNGFRLTGISAGDQSGMSISSAGDVNGDGYDDIIVGALLAGGTGRAYVIFGKENGWTSDIDLAALDGSTGFRLDGAASGDQAGFSVATAGDINADGFADLLIGATLADPDGVQDAGAAFVVYGRSGGWAATLALGALDGSSGFRLDGVGSGDGSANAVSSAGDVNGDGFSDIVVGAAGADIGGSIDPGAAYVIFGRIPTAAVTRVGAAGDQVIRGGAFSDTLDGRGGHDRLYGGGGDDNLVGGDGNDMLFGGAGGDVLVGGSGYDYARYDDADYSSLTVSLTIQSLNSGAAAGDILIGIEGLVLGSGNDWAYGNADGNYLYGMSGNDHLFGSLGADHHDGGEGFDYARYDDAGYASFAVSLASQSIGTGVAAGDTFINVEGLVLGQGDDWGYGDEAANYIYGMSGNDNLFGSLGGDYLDGGAGFDYARFDDAAYEGLTASLANDVAGTGAAGGDFFVNIEGLILTGHADTGIGDAGTNYLYGLAGSDTLYGREGRDHLFGGAPGETDYFVFDVAAMFENADIIGDFEHGVDKIALSNSIYGGNQSVYFDSGTGNLFWSGLDQQSSTDDALIATLLGVTVFDSGDYYFY